MSSLPQGPGALKEEKQVWSLLSSPPPSLVKNILYRKQKGPVLVSPRGLCFPKHSANRSLSKLESFEAHYKVRLGSVFLPASLAFGRIMSQNGCWALGYHVCVPGRRKGGSRRPSVAGSILRSSVSTFLDTLTFLCHVSSVQDCRVSGFSIFKRMRVTHPGAVTDAMRSCQHLKHALEPHKRAGPESRALGPTCRREGQEAVSLWTDRETGDERLPKAWDLASRPGFHRVAKKTFW